MHVDPFATFDPGRPDRLEPGTFTVHCPLGGTHVIWVTVKVVFYNRLKHLHMKLGSFNLLKRPATVMVSHQPRPSATGHWPLAIGHWPPRHFDPPASCRSRPLAAPIGPGCRQLVLVPARRPGPLALAIGHWPLAIGHQPLTACRRPRPPAQETRRFLAWFEKAVAKIEGLTRDERDNLFGPRIEHQMLAATVTGDEGVGPDRLQITEDSVFEFFRATAAGPGRIAGGITGLGLAEVRQLEGNREPPRQPLAIGHWPSRPLALGPQPLTPQPLARQRPNPTPLQRWCFSTSTLASSSPRSRELSPRSRRAAGAATSSWAETRASRPGRRSPRSSRSPGLWGSTSLCSASGSPQRRPLTPTARTHACWTLANLAIGHWPLAIGPNPLAIGH